ncbi:polysaccharide biosynthesis/export family protein [Allosphingosinicella humi]
MSEPGYTCVTGASLSNARSNSNSANSTQNGYRKGLAQAYVIATTLAAAALLSGCASTRGGAVPYDVEGFGAPDSPAPVALDADYKIAPLDTLAITVFKFDDLSGDYEVDLMGNIAMPLVGSVKASDKTTAQLKDELTRVLGEKYIQSPDVTVGIKSSSNRSVTVDGSVRLPGLFPVKGPMTLMQAIALARGTDENANPRRIAIFRTIDGKRVAAAFDLVSIRRGEMKDPEVYNGDIVVVDGSATKAIYRNLLQTLPVIGLFRPY